MSNGPRRVWLLFSVIAVLITFAWLLPSLTPWAPMWYVNLLSKLPARASVVDPSLEALFSGLAFAGVILAIVLQQQELALQREELRATRTEIEGQRKQLEAQAQTLRKQNFEDTFFRMLELHNGIVSQISLKLPFESPANGRECFTELYNRLRGSFVRAKQEAPSAAGPVLIDTAWDRFFESSGSLVGHYFRHLYQIIRFVSESDRPNKQFYTNLVRAQLSTYELALLFYNCLGAIGRRRFKGLVEEYALLEQLVPENEKLLLDAGDRSLYKPGAFQERE